MTSDQDSELFKELHFFKELDQRTLATEQQIAAAGRANVRATTALAIAIVSMIVTVVGISITHIEMDEMSHERLTTHPIRTGDRTAGHVSANRKWGRPWAIFLLCASD
jgi:hypothetical protein